MHPQAHNEVPRLHLPVAPKCNCRCSYCEREVSLSSASLIAPVLSASVLSPDEALVKTRSFLGKWGETAVVGVAGPGEPLANEETIQSLRLIRNEFSELVLCLCTNGLNLPDYCDELLSLRVQHLTITINGVDPSVVGRIQPMVEKDGLVYKGNEAGALLIRNQMEGLRLALKGGMFVKVNMVVVPGINGHEVVSTAQAVKALGAGVFNPIPLIPRGAFKRMEAPTYEFMSDLRSSCGGFINVFHQCKQCRADAEGIPGKEKMR